MQRLATVATALIIVGMVVSIGGGFVDVATAGTEEQDQEPNDDFDTADTLLEGQMTGEITSADSDFYRIQLNATDALNVTEIRDNDGRGSGLNVVVYGPNRTRLASDGNRGGTGPVVVKASENGTYYVEVTGEADSVRKNYTLFVNKVTPRENDQFAPNDDFNSAATPVEGSNDAKIWGGESDFYRIQLNATDALNVTEIRDNDGRGSGLNVVVYGPNRTRLASDRNAGGTSPVVVKASGNGTYYVEVTGEDDSVTKNYTLFVNKVTPRENDQFAPNDDFNSAAAIENRTSNAKIWGGESDFYRVGLNESEGLRVDPVPNSARLDVHIYGPDRTQLASGNNRGGAGSVSITAPETGIYFVEVVGETSTTTTEYTLKSNRTGLATEEVGPVERFNTNGGGIDIGELGNAAAAFARGDLTINALGKVAAAFARS